MNEWLTLAWSQRSELASATLVHLSLVLESIVLAILIGVPLGVLATRRKSAERFVLGLANIFQTIPSLALLGFLLILFGGTIGKLPALTALVVYALLPIIKNTILGIQGLDPNVAEAAVGLGMTPWQRLTLVELPLAVPVLLGGIRIATVSAVGMATIAASIGAGGLGTYIFRGVSLSDPRLILLGAIPAAGLALLCDSLIGLAERRLDPTKGSGSRRNRWVIGALVIALFALVLGENLSSRTGPGKIVIGSKDGTEMILIGQMLAELVEARTDLKVDRKFNLGGSLVCYNALKDGGLDAYVEYTGTALAAILKEPPQNDPKAVYDRVKAECERRDGVAVLDPLGFENTFAIVMRAKQARDLGLKKISDLQRHQGRLRTGFGPEFMSRADGYDGLMKAYGLSFTERPRELDRNLLYQAVAQETLDVAAGDSTDGRIASLDLVVLDDDRHYFPPYEALVFANLASLNRHPALREALSLLSGKIDADKMRLLNYEVDGKRREPAEVAHEFLLLNKFLE